MSHQKITVRFSLGPKPSKVHNFHCTNYIHIVKSLHSRYPKDRKKCPDSKCSDSKCGVIMYTICDSEKYTSYLSRCPCALQGILFYCIAVENRWGRVSVRVGEREWERKGERERERERERARES